MSIDNDPLNGEAVLALPSFDNRASLRQKVTEALRAQLITGQMRPGTLYSAPRLAAQFGISATPVREAMLDLVSEGLVEVVRNKGFRVTELTGEELDELAELRHMVEVQTMTRIAEECTEETAAEIEALRPLARDIVTYAKNLDIVAYIEADTEFHIRFLSLHGNGQLVKVVRDLRRRSRLFGLEDLADDGSLGKFAAEHEEMVDLALARDAAGMERLLSRHIGHVRAAWAGDAGQGLNQQGGAGAKTLQRHESVAARGR